MCVRDHSAIGCLNIEDCAGLSYVTERHGSLRLCGGKTSEEGCTLDIFVVSICFVKLFVMFVCFMSCPHSTLWHFGHTVVHVGIFRFSRPFRLRSEMEIVSERCPVHTLT